MASVLDIYFSSVIAASMSATGDPVGGGTVIAPEAAREGSLSASSYPTPSGTIVLCDPTLVDQLADALRGATGDAIDSAAFVRLSLRAGATLSGFGNSRVLADALRRPAVDAAATGVSVCVLHRDRAEDQALLAALASATSADEREQAGLDLDHLDENIVGLLDRERLLACASGLPSWINERFDDIGVLTHPDHRRRGLAALAVSEFVHHRISTAADQLMLYRCRTDNAGSNRVAESLGFTFAHTVGTVRFASTSN